MQRTGEVRVPGVAVADDDAGVAGENMPGVDGVRGPVPGVHERQVGGAGQVHVPQPAGGAGRGLVREQRRGLPQQVPHPVPEPAGPDQHGGLAPDPGHPPRRDRHPAQLA